MHAATIEAICAVATVLGGIGGFVYAFGKFVASVHDNTRATDRLTESFDKHADVHDHVDSRLGDHEIRISVLETKRH